jgi:rSAM/selenodomain-associated transferase 1
LNTRIVIFAKAPRPGKVKTRLIPALGAEGAAALAGYLLHSTLDEVLQSQADSVELCTEPAFADPAWHGVSLPAGVNLSSQGAGDLGERMARVAQRVLNQGERVILIGTDCPDLTRQKLNEAITALQTWQAVMFEALDGGYTLLGLQAFDPSLFTQIAWSSSKVSEQTHLAFSRLGWQCKVLGQLPDIDRPEDLRWLPDVEALISE